MIAKISATANLGGALGYNFKKVDKGEASVLAASGLYLNPDGQYGMEQVLADMRQLIPDRCRTKKTVFHCSLNPHPDEKLSDERLAQIAKEYMEALGYGEQPYIVFKHNDIAREHIHIVSLRVDGKGQKINDRFERRRSKRITDALESKYHLIPSSKAAQRVDNEMPVIDTSHENIRGQIGTLMHAVLKHYRFCSLGELNAVLTAYRLAVEEVKTEFRGRQYDGLVYVPTDDAGVKTGVPVRASDIGRGVGYTAVYNHIRRSKAQFKPFLPGLRQRVLGVMCSGPKTEEEMVSALAQAGVRILIRRTDKGRLYGITFIDDRAGIAANGSRLGRGYSAAVFDRYLNSPETNPFLDEGLYGSRALLKCGGAMEEHLSMSTDDNVWAEDWVEDLLQPTGGNDDWKEAAWQRKLRRMNRIRLGRKKR